MKSISEETVQSLSQEVKKQMRLKKTEVSQTDLPTESFVVAAVPVCDNCHQVVLHCKCTDNELRK